MNRYLLTNARLPSGGTGSVWVEDGRIKALHDVPRPVGLALPAVDLDGARIFPGLVDGHFHLRNLGQTRRWMDLTVIHSIDDLLDALRAYASGSGFLFGRGWDEHRWGGAPLNAALLDRACPARPVWLTRIDGHVACLNSAALGALSVREIPDEPGGSLARDEAGDPTGLLLDRTMERAFHRIPPVPDREVEEDVRRGVAMALDAGLTSVHDMGTTAQELDVLATLAAAGELGIEVVSYLWADADADARLSTPTPGPLRIAGIKLLADGALGSHGALLHQEYADRPGCRGLQLSDVPEMSDWRRRAEAAHRRVAIHAIGDAANTYALDALGPAPLPGHRVEHAQIVGAQDLARFRETGTIASVQPSHLLTDAIFLDHRIGQDRMGDAYRWGSFAAAGVALVLGSDAPVEAPDPWRGIQAAVGPRHGRDREGLSFAAALHGCTDAARRAVGDDTPRLIPGAPADLTIVSREDPPRSIATVVGGVFRGSSAMPSA